MTCERKQFSFVMPWEVVPKGRPRFARVGGFVRTYTDKKTSDFEKTVGIYARQAMARAGFSKAVAGEEVLAVSITCYFTPPKSWTKKRLAFFERAHRLPMAQKPDIDNAAKSVLDGMNGIVYDDDKMIFRLTIGKFYRLSKPTVEVSVTVLPAFAEVDYECE